MKLTSFTKQVLRSRREARVFERNGFVRVSASMTYSLPWHTMMSDPRLSWDGKTIWVKLVPDRLAQQVGKSEPTNLGPGYVVPFSAATKAAMDKLGKEDA